MRASMLYVAAGLLLTSVAPAFAAVINPSFTPSVSTVTVDENSGAYDTLWAVSIDAGSTDSTAHTGAEFQLLYLNVSRTYLFSVQPAVSLTGRLSFTPAVDQHTEGITCQLAVRLVANNANGSVASCDPLSSCPTLTIEIRRTNRAPFATLTRSTLSLDENFGDQTASGTLWWSGVCFTGISAGSATESQSVTFSTTVSNSAIFNTLPQVYPNGTMSFELVPYRSGSSTISITPQDDGTPPMSGSTYSISLTVNPVNHPPVGTMTLSGTQTVQRDASPGTYVWSPFLTGVRPAGTMASDEYSQTLSVSASCSPASALASLTATLTGTNVDLALDPTSAYMGNATITVTVRDNGGSVRGQDSTDFSIEIALPSTNLNPNFTVPATYDVMITDSRFVTSGNSTSFAQSLFATDITAGAGEDGTQSVTFSVVPDSTSIFTVQPTLNAIGRLEFSVLEGSHGTFVLSITAQDSLGLTRTRQVAFTIQFVNACPRITIPLDPINVLEGVGSLTYADWATDIDAGRALEDTVQTLSFTTTTTDDAAFSAMPLLTRGSSDRTTATLTFRLQPAFAGTVDVDVLVRDSGGTSNGGCDNRTVSFSITADFVNHAPSYTPTMLSITVSENAGAVTYPSWATSITPGDSGESSQTIAFSVELLNTTKASLFAAPIEVTTTGQLSFEAHTDANTIYGPVEFRVVLTDNLGATSCNITTCIVYSLTINPVNTRPSFTMGPDIVVWEDLGNLGGDTVFIQDNWASGISVGSVREATNEGQHPTFYISTNSSGIFNSTPMISPTGQLSFVLQPDANGVSLLTVVLSDNTVSPSRESIAQSFLVHVLPVNDAPVRKLDGADITTSMSVDFHINAVRTYNLGTIQPGPDTAADELATQSTVSYDCVVTPTLNSNLCEVTRLAGGELQLRFQRFASEGDGTMTITITDDGGTDRNGVNFLTFDIAMSVGNYNDPPHYELASNLYTTLQQSVPETVVYFNWATGITAHNAEDSYQTVSFICTNDNTTLFSAQPTIATDGTLSFVPTTNAVGGAMVECNIRDSGSPPLEFPRWFRIRVTPVNQCPSFLLDRSVVSVDQQSGLQAFSYDDFLYNIRVGTDNEAFQTLQYLVVTSEPNLFSSQPAVGPMADRSKARLTFTPAPGVNGQATVTVSIKDDGGLQDGGCDTSQQQSFIIAVNYVNVPPSFVCGAGVTVAENSGAHTIQNWAGSISRGVEAESNQRIYFSVQPVTLSWTEVYQRFRRSPYVDSRDGTLNFEYNADLNTYASGPLTFRVILYDQGNTDRTWTPSCSVLTACCNLTTTVTPVNHPPRFVGGADITLSEDLLDQTPVPQTLRYTVPGWATGIYIGTPSEVNEQNQTVEFTATTANPGLFTSLPHVFPNGTLTFTLRPHTSGSSTVAINIRDTGAAPNTGEEHTLSIVVNSVNDAPVGTLARQSINVAENSGAAQFDDLFSTRSPAAADVSDENDQTLHVSISVLNGTELFSVQPHLDSNGVLHFTPARYKFGVASVVLRLVDDGGTDNGGVDTTAFPTTIVVEHVNQPPVLEVRETFIRTLANAGQEMHGSFIVNATPGRGDEAIQTVTVRAVARAPSMFAQLPVVNLTTGTLSFAVAREAVGDAVVDFVAVDSGNPALSSATRTLTINILAVNIAPTFDLPTWLNVSQCATDDPLCSVARRAFASNASAGPASEATQSVAFALATPLDASSLFDVLPGMNPAGDLSFRLKPGMSTYGRDAVPIQVTLRDDGGNANGGADSATKTFLLRVIPSIPAVTFTLGEDITVAQNSAAVSLSSWISQLSRGSFPLSELALFVVAADPGMFRTGPRLVWAGGATADLVFQPNETQSGTTVITVTAYDPVVDRTVSASRRVVVEEVLAPPQATVVSPLNVYQTDGVVLSTVLSAMVVTSGTRLVTSNISCVVTNATVTPLFVSLPSMVSPTGQVTLQPNRAAVGSAKCDIMLLGESVSNSAAQVTARFETIINVLAPNRPPVFDLNRDAIVVPQADSVFSEVNFTTGMHPGATSEAGQLLSFVVDCHNSSWLFATIPTISPAGTLSFVPSTEHSGTATCAVTLFDDGPGDAPNSNRSATTRFTVSVMHVNRAPTFNVRTDAVLAQSGTGTSQVQGFISSVSRGHTSEGSQALTVSVSAEDTAQVEEMPVVSLRAAPFNDGMLNIALRQSTYGVVRLSVCVEDDGGTAYGGSNRTCRPASLFVTRVNQRPTATLAPQVTVPQTAEPFTLAGWLRDVNPGPGDADQTITSRTISCGSTATQLFISTPTVSENGTLTVWPFPSESGAATCTLSVRDSAGGTLTENFEISTLRVNRAPQMSLTVSSIEATEGDTYRRTVMNSVRAGSQQWENTQQTVAVAARVEPPGISQEFAMLPTVDTSSFALSFTLRNGTTLQSFQLVLVASDDGGTSFGGVDSSVAPPIAVTVRRRPVAPSVNLRQTFIGVLEGAGPTTIDGLVIGYASAVHRASVTCSPRDGFHQMPLINASGGLVFAMRPHWYGEADCSVVVSDLDSELRTSLPFTLSVTNVNDQPQFARRGNISLGVGAERTVSRWASDISAGDGEVAQTLRFEATPRIAGTLDFVRVDAATGDLTVRSGQQPGTAIVDVTLVDNGGTAFGGTDRSVTVALEVTVTEVDETLPLLVIGAGDLRFPDPVVRREAVKSAGWVQLDRGATTIVAVSSNVSVVSRAWIDIPSGDLWLVPEAAGTAVLTLRALRGTEEFTLSLSVAFASVTMPTDTFTTTAQTTAPASARPELIFDTTAAPVVLRPGRPQTIQVFAPASLRPGMQLTVATNVSALTFVTPPSVSPTTGALSIAVAVSTRENLTAAVRFVVDGEEVAAAMMHIRPPQTIVRTTLSTTVELFDANAFKQRIATAVGVVAEQVIVTAVRSGSVVVDFYIDHTTWEPNSAPDALAPRLAADLSNPGSSVAQEVGSVSSATTPNAAETAGPASTVPASTSPANEPTAPQTAPNDGDDDPLVSSTLIIVALIVIVVLIVGAVITIVVVRRRSKPKAEMVEGPRRRRRAAYDRDASSASDDGDESDTAAPVKHTAQESHRCADPEDLFVDVELEYSSSEGDDATPPPHPTSTTPRTEARAARPRATSRAGNPVFNQGLGRRGQPLQRGKHDAKATGGHAAPSWMANA